MTSHPPAPGEPAQPPGAPASQPPHPTVEEPLPPRKKRTGLIIGIIAGAVLVPVLAIGGLIFWAWLDNYNRFERVHEMPNADRLIDMPRGPAPASIGRLALMSIDESTRYATADHATIGFREHDLQYWDARVRGGVWEANGDLMCEMPPEGHGTVPSFCVMAFADTTISVHPDPELYDDVSELTEQYLARKAGEPVETDWYDTPPPNIDALPTIADLGARMPDVLKGDFLELPLLTDSGATDHSHWYRGYGEDQLTMSTFAAHIDHGLWGYYTAFPDLQRFGDALCTDDMLATCVLAGSDGLLVINTALLSSEEAIAAVESALE